MLEKHINKITIAVILLVTVVGCFVKINYHLELKKQNKNKNDINKILTAKEKESQLINQIYNHYNEIVTVKNDAKLYKLSEDNYQVIGTIYKDNKIFLDKLTNVDKNTKYFKLKNLEYYISYVDVEPFTDDFEINKDYKNYLPWNENVVTTEKSNLYSEEGKLVYSLDISLNLPLIIKDDDKYYVEYDNNLYYIKNTEAKLVVNNNNNSTSATSISTLAYHFFYDASKGDNCNQIICLSNTKFDEQMKYLKDNNYYTATMHAFELWLDKKIRLPKNTVVLTIDDGYNVEEGIKVLEKYGLHATLFLVTSWNLPEKYKTNVLEYHSHSHNMHNTGVCPNGQGGGIQCLPRDEILSDLKKSQDLLNGSFVFCYPFYEYNEYSISVLKEAGYRMAFGGNRVKTYQGYNKFKLPRYTILSDDTLQSFISYIR